MLLHELGDPLQTAAALDALQGTNSALPWLLSLSKFWAVTSLLSPVQSGLPLQPECNKMKSTSNEVRSCFPVRENEGLRAVIHLCFTTLCNENKPISSAVKAIVGSYYLQEFFNLFLQEFSFHILFVIVT